MVYRSQAHKTTLSLRAYQRKSRNFVEDTEIRLQHRQTAGWELGLNQRSYLGDATLDAGLNWRRGSGMLGALNAPEEETGNGGSRPSIVSAELSYTQPLQIGAQKLRLNSQWRGQWSKGALVPHNRFSIGGRYTVRGFDGDLSLSSERGWLWRNELSWAMGPSGRSCIWAWTWARQRRRQQPADRPATGRRRRRHARQPVQAPVLRHVHRLADPETRRLPHWRRLWLQPEPAILIFEFGAGGKTLHRVSRPYREFWP